MGGAKLSAETPKGATETPNVINEVTEMINGTPNAVSETSNATIGITEMLKGVSVAVFPGENPESRRGFALLRQKIAGNWHGEKAVEGFRF